MVIEKWPMRKEMQLQSKQGCNKISVQKKNQEQSGNNPWVDQNKIPKHLGNSHKKIETRKYLWKIPETHTEYS